MRSTQDLLWCCLICASLCPFLTHSQVITGGAVPATVSELIPQANFAVSELNTKADVPNQPLTLVKVVSAQKQVVAGMNYFMQLQVKDSTNTVHLYNVTVYSPLPVGGNAAPLQLTDYQLADSKGSDGQGGALTGGLTPPSVDSSSLVDAQYVIDQLNNMTAIPTGPLKLSTVVSVQTQVVAGTNIFLQLLAADSLNNTYAINASVYEPLPVSGLPQSLTSYSVTVNTLSDYSQFRFPANVSDFYDEAMFSVNELNSKPDVADKPLQLTGVASAEAQVSSTIDIYLGLLVKDNENKTRLYNVTVSEPLPSSSVNSTMQLRNYTMVSNDATKFCAQLLALSIVAAAMLWF